MNFKRMQIRAACIAMLAVSMGPLVSANALELVSCNSPFVQIDGWCQLVRKNPTNLNLPATPNAGGYLHYRGRIQPADYDLVRIKLSQMPRLPSGQIAPEIWIESIGGDVNAAMQIGTLLRASMATVVASGTCASSCIFVLLGGVERGVMPDDSSASSFMVNSREPKYFGRVGVHRAYRASVSALETAQQIRSERNALKQRVVKYLDDMDIAPELASLMDATPPEEMRYLTKQELARFRITGRDPTYDEREIASAAEFYKLTSAEYRARVVAANLLCNSIDISKPVSHGLREMADCTERVLRKGK